MKVLRSKSTFGLLSFETGRLYLLQFTLKEPWLVPRCDRNYGENKDIVLFGWLFVYFGHTDLR